MNIEEEIEKCLANCDECENMFASDGRYANAIYTQGEAFAYRKVLRLLKEAKAETETQFSWVDVNIGDEVETYTGRTGKVTDLLYTKNGFSGMGVLFAGTSVTVYYRNDGYKQLKRIGDWVNKE